MSTVACRLPYGQGDLTVEVPEADLLDVVTAAADEADDDEAGIITRALGQPIGSPRLEELVEPGQTVCVVTSDMTRPCPSDRILPHILAELGRAGVGERDVVIVMALGLHRAMTAPELEAAVGSEVWKRYRVINHDPEDVVQLGTTAAGTPVEVFREVVEADFRVCLGNLEFHYFAGFSGGAKAIVPGCASRATLNANHAMMVRPEATAGRIEDNPVRRDLEEATGMVGGHFMLNVLVGSSHRICEAVAGDLTAAHRRGCELVAARGAVSIPACADIVLVSSGGHPSDVNMYQAQKALDNAVHAVRPGGVIIWVAECGERFGNATFESWLTEAESPGQILDRIQAGFVLGGHKAAALAAVMQQASVYLVSGLDDEAVCACGLRPFVGLDEALRAARAEVGEGATILSLPNGGSVMPSPA